MMETHLPGPEPRFRLAELIKTIRPHQWLKNAFLFAPLVFARHLFSWQDLARVAMAFVAFSLVAGAIYILNDVMDVEVDRAHPTKRHRPIPAGRLGIRDALAAMAALVVISLGALAWLSWSAAALAGGYFLLNVAYSRQLKHVAFVDVATIGVGFVVRVLVGAVVIDVPFTAWLLACTFLLAVYLGLGKRRHELLLMQETGEAKRPVLERYRLEHLDLALWGSAGVTAVSYLLYTLDPVTVAKFGTRALVWTTPFIVFGLLRFRALMVRADNPRSPTDSMLHDPLFAINLLAWGAVIVAIVYGGV